MRLFKILCPESMITHFNQHQDIVLCLLDLVSFGFTFKLVCCVHYQLQYYNFYIIETINQVLIWLKLFEPYMFDILTELFNRVVY